MTRTSRLHVLLARRWRLAQCLRGARTGRTVAHLADRLGVSRATLYRDLDFLREVGAPLTAELVNGETRYRLLGDGPPVPGSPLRGLALDLAIASLEPLRGSKLVQELSQLRKDLPAGPPAPRVSVAPPPTGGPAEVIAAVERALGESREVALLYRGAKDAAASERTVLPLELQVVKGQVYLLAHDPARGEARTFKVARVDAARAGARFERAALPAVAPAPSVVVWRGPRVEVVVRLAPGVARFAAEYPLVAGQRLEPEPDGAARVHAEVAGEVEALRWVLSWGRGATVLAPPSLRALHRAELLAALAGYGAEERVSHAS